MEYRDRLRRNPRPTGAERGTRLHSPRIPTYLCSSDWLWNETRGVADETVRGRFDMEVIISCHVDRLRTTLILVWSLADKES